MITGFITATNCKISIKLKKETNSKKSGRTEQEKRKRKRGD